MALTMCCMHILNAKITLSKMLFLYFSFQCFRNILVTVLWGPISHYYFLCTASRLLNFHIILYGFTFIYFLWICDKVASKNDSSIFHMKMHSAFFISGGLLYQSWFFNQLVTYAFLLPQFCCNTYILSSLSINLCISSSSIPFFTLLSHSLVPILITSSWWVSCEPMMDTILIIPSFHGSGWLISLLSSSQRSWRVGALGFLSF